MKSEAPWNFYVPEVGPVFVLMDDTAYPYRAVIVDEYVESVVIACVKWLVNSLEINLIGHFWDA